ncbi:MAG: hypothetical protein NTV78_00305 [Caldiserica bacterium]|nr:hypothetical protein [Caldisericota bacterium]
MNFIKKSKKGFALILVILIAVAMMIPVLMLLSSTIPRRTNVVGEAVSDRSLVLADSTVDHILDTINTFPFTFTTPTMIDDLTGEATKKAQDYLISYYISQLNGGVPDINNPIVSYDLISSYGSTYLYSLDTQEYYAVWDNTNGPNGNIAHISDVGPDGSISQTGNIKNLSTNVVSSLPFTNIDADYKTDNLWVEIDTNTKYWPGEPDKWKITTTAYLLSKPEIKRTIEASASRGEVTTTVEDVADGNWYTYETSEKYTTVYYSDFSGLYHTRVYFGRFETTRGMIRGDENVWMGGWAEDPVYAYGVVTDQAIDDGNRHDGKFGPDKNNLNWAKTNDPKYATDGYPAASWPKGDEALKGATAIRKPLTETGLQDKALDDYYVNGNATIVFSVDGDGISWVTINGNKLPIPSNGAIYVEGTATVSGTVKGRCTVGAGGNINIGGNIVYNTPPRVDKYTPNPPGDPDSLGLIAYSNVVIPKSTFDANHHLQIDAAMLAVHGWFGIDSSTSWHTINGSGEYEAWWQGCQAMWSTSNAPAIVSGSSVKGYDIQHTYFDWNLYDFGPPPFYPATNNRENLTLIERYVIVTDPTLQGILRSLHKSDLTPTGDPAYPYMKEYGGVTYYFNGHFDNAASATMQNTALYRITWKEQVANPVKPVNP